MPNASCQLTWRLQVLWRGSTCSPVTDNGTVGQRPAVKAGCGQLMGAALRMWEDSPVRPVALWLFISCPLTDWTTILYSWPGCRESNVNSFCCLRMTRTLSSRSPWDRNTEYPSTSPCPGVQLTFRVLLPPSLLTWMFFTLLGTEEEERQLEGQATFFRVHSVPNCFYYVDLVCGLLPLVMGGSQNFSSSVGTFYVFIEGYWPVRPSMKWALWLGPLKVDTRIL